MENQLTKSRQNKCINHKQPTEKFKNVTKGRQRFGQSGVQAGEAGTSLAQQGTKELRVAK